MTRSAPNRRRAGLALATLAWLGAALSGCEAGGVAPPVDDDDSAWADDDDSAWTDDDDGVMSHAAHIQPIWTMQCLLCHITGGYGGGLVLESGYETLVGVRSLEAPHMLLVAPGAPEDSYLWHKLSGTHLDVGGWGEPMPYQDQLCQSDLDRVEAWIEAGALP
jgi:hypothetical protein